MTWVQFFDNHFVGLCITLVVCCALMRASIVKVSR